MSNAVWSEAAPSVLHFAENLINEFHPWLKAARICFVFRNEAQKQGDRFILGQATKVPDKMKPHFEYDFLIWISENDYTPMPELQQEALVDHQLCHCVFGNMGWKIRPHDIQEFSDVIARHGIYSPDVQAAKSSIDTWQTETLPGLIVERMDKTLGKIDTLKGAQLEIMTEAQS